MAVLMLEPISRTYNKLLHQTGVFSRRQSEKPMFSITGPAYILCVHSEILTLVNFICISMAHWLVEGLVNHAAQVSEEG